MNGKYAINSIVPITQDTYEAFSSKTNGGDALLLYIRFIYQSRLQGNTITRSTDGFMMTAMGWGATRYKAAKCVLKEFDLIEATPIKGEDGKIINWGVEVFGLTSLSQKETEERSDESELCKAKRARSTKNHRVDSPPSGKRETKHSIYNNINKNIEDKEEKKESKTKVILGIINKYCIKHGLKLERELDVIKTISIIYNSKKIQEVCTSYSFTTEELVEAIVAFSYEDSWWRGKIASANSFLRNWEKLYNTMVVNKKLQKKLDIQKTTDIMDSIF